MLSPSKLHKAFKKKYIFNEEEQEDIQEHCDGNTSQGRILNRRLKLFNFTYDTPDMRRDDRRAVVRYNKIVRKYKVNRGFWVWSGIKFHPQQYQKKVGKPIRVPALTFMSTSLNKWTAYDFSAAPKHDFCEALNLPRYKVWSADQKRFATPEELAEYDKWTSSYSWSWTQIWKFGYLIEHTHVLKIWVPRSAHGAYLAHYGRGFQSEKEFLLPIGSVIELEPEYKIDWDGYKIIWTGRLIHDGTKSLRSKYRRH